MSASSRVFLVPRVGDGSDEAPFAPNVPDNISWKGYPRGDQFLVATDADLTAVPGVVELTGDDLDAACATWGIDRAALGVAT
jgi:hypothetical protein